MTKWDESSVWKNIQLILTLLQRRSTHNLVKYRKQIWYTATLLFWNVSVAAGQVPWAARERDGGGAGLGVVLWVWHAQERRQPMGSPMLVPVVPVVVPVDLGLWEAVCWGPASRFLLHRRLGRLGRLGRLLPLPAPGHAARCFEAASRVPLLWSVSLGDWGVLPGQPEAQRRVPDWEQRSY